MQDEAPRFHVVRVQGLEIDPARLGKGRASNKPLSCAYYVHDRAYCDRVVAVFPKPTPRWQWLWPGSYRDGINRAKAEAWAAELNAKHAALEAAA
jgi:hypothetical protein